MYWKMSWLPEEKLFLPKQAIWFGSDNVFDPSSWNAGKYQGRAGVTLLKNRSLDLGK